MNGIGATILLALMLIVTAGARRWALLAMMAGVLLLPQEQQLYLAGLNIFPTRFLELAGFIRVMTRKEFTFRKLNGIDRAFIYLYGLTTVIYLFRATEGQLEMVGHSVDAFLSYFAFRGLISNMSDFRWLLRSFVFVLAPFAVLVLSESLTGHNPFTVLGAVDGGTFWSRHGRPRCFGSFRQPDTLGMFAASFIPLFIGMACTIQGRKHALIAIFPCLVITWAANSGGAAGAAFTGISCWVFWWFRKEMCKVRRALVLVLILSAIAMKAPVWYLFAHISDITGGDGWHRSYLIDVAYRHVSEWWFMGMSFLKTKDWFPYTLGDAGMADICDQYIAWGLASGLGAIALFILLLVRAYSNLGKALAVIRSRSQQPSADEFLLWGLGVMLMVHIVDWFGITYFDQMYMVWFLQLAAISTLSQAYLELSAPVVFGQIIIDTQMVEREAAIGLGHAD